MLLSRAQSQAWYNFEHHAVELTTKDFENMASFDLVKPKHRELLGGDLLAQSLKALGVDTAFGLHGGPLDAFLIGAHEMGIKLVDTRHETVSVQGAEGYARVSGKVGVCFVTANSGYVIKRQSAKSTVQQGDLLIMWASPAFAMHSQDWLQLSLIDHQSSASRALHLCATQRPTHCKVFTTRL